ncbi:MAG TPA: hypothetical protein VFU47_07205, partial [Armatimonadota bacterium]|nr:hypothetical protein [Armatimonadota bacterium]
MTFAMVARRRPPSAQKGPNLRFQEALRELARDAWLGQNLLSGALYARIVWFHSVPKGGDVDNIT